MLIYDTYFSLSQYDRLGVHSHHYKGPSFVLSMAELYCIVYMYHNFFTHSSVNGHLVSFLVLAVVNSAAVNTGMYVSFGVMVFSQYMSKNGIAEVIW